RRPFFAFVEWQSRQYFFKSGRTSSAYFAASAFLSASFAVVCAGGRNKAKAKSAAPSSSANPAAHRTRKSRLFIATPPTLPELHVCPPLTGAGRQESIVASKRDDAIPFPRSSGGMAPDSAGRPEKGPHCLGGERCATRRLFHPPPFSEFLADLAGGKDCLVVSALFPLSAG